MGGDLGLESIGYSKTVVFCLTVCRVGCNVFLFSWQEPVNVPAILTHKTCCGGIGPIKVEKRCNRRV